MVDGEANVSPARIAGAGTCALALSVETPSTVDGIPWFSGGKPTDDARGETGALLAC